MWHITKAESFKSRWCVWEPPISSRLTSDWIREAQGFHQLRTKAQGVMSKDTDLHWCSLLFKPLRAAFLSPLPQQEKNIWKSGVFYLGQSGFNRSGRQKGKNAKGDKEGTGEQTEGKFVHLAVIMIHLVLRQGEGSPNNNLDYLGQRNRSVHN